MGNSSLLLSWLQRLNDIPLCQINVTVVICCGRSTATHFLQDRARAMESTTAKQMCTEKQRLGLHNANKLARVLKCYGRQHQSTIGAWPARDWSGFMCLGMTNQECKEVTLILHNHWYLKTSLSLYSKGSEKNGLSLSLPLHLLQIFKLARKVQYTAGLLELNKDHI